MDVYTWYGELASKSIPIGIAIFVYIVWHQQKAKEVKAKHAENLMLAKLSMGNEYYKKLTTIAKDNKREKLDEFYDLVNDLLNKARLFSKLLDYEPHRNQLAKLIRSYVQLRSFIFKLKGNSELNDTYEIRKLLREKYVFTESQTKEQEQLLIDYIKYKNFLIKRLFNKFLSR